MDSPLLIPQTFVNNTVGALQIGVLVSYVLFGITTTQAYIYYGRFPEDPIWIRSMVALVWLLEAAQAALVGYVLYFYTVTDFGDRNHVLQNALPALMVAFILTGAITTLVELFFTYRINQLSQRLLIPIALSVLAVVYFMGTLSIAIAGFKTGTWAGAESQWGWDILATAILSVVTDLGISAVLVFLLFQNRQQGTANTAAMIDQVIAWTIETGVVTSLCSVLILIFYEKMTQSFVWLAVLIVKSRLFSNSLLASLNSRSSLRKMTNVSLPSSAPQFSHSQAGSRLEDVEMFRVEAKLHRDNRLGKAEASV
ncbi:hypothetical protein MIND_01389600 [Mycena indigotica]|uniref:DUF6534 domain-containing protein n=1 Tax=Mycena indigotica TaxID=2126181 RepID=A0A8H6RWW8_9AGAR|nr:uncharacterized protein MIND_01389600 [Mycena indigotica]KAF7289280.1 hypothetical protein MIND_01389600 [Mycena indigotica]